MISRRKLRDFYESKPDRLKNAHAFDSWFHVARRARWHNFQETKATFGQTDVVTDTRTGRTATIFDVGGNKYRIVALVSYTRQTVFITHVMDHKEYNKGKWKSEI